MEEGKSMAKQSNRNQMDTIVKLVLIFLISLLSFAVGTFVGKGVSESEYRKAALERGDYKSFKETVAVNDGISTEPGGLPEKEIDNLIKEFVESEKKKMKMNKTTQVKSAENHGHSQMNKKVAPMTKKRSHNTDRKPIVSQTLGTSKASKRKPASLSSIGITSIAKYTVQIASYATEAEAKKHSQKLKTKGYHAFYVSAQVKGRTWYRVNVGRFTNKSNARAYRAQLMMSDGIKTAIVRKTLN